jgi:hypothetical protein
MKHQSTDISTLRARLQGTALNVGRDKCLRHTAYRCALAAEAVYSDTPQQLQKQGLPDATEEQIDELFDGDYVALFKQYADTFRTKLFFDSHADRFILAFAGTELTNRDHWNTNVRQFFGQADEHYHWATDIARHIVKNKRVKIIVTGHSLGGGLATVCALAGGMEACVFNPPCIHVNTLEQFSALHKHRAEQHIQRFVVFGEALDIVNKLLGVNHRRIGTKTQLYGSIRIPISSLLSVTVLFRRFIPVAGPVLAVGAPILEKTLALHGMDEVLCGLRKHLS